MSGSAKVLIIEDDAWLSEMFAKVLRNSGFTVDSAHHAHQAIEKLDDFVPDVVLLDVFLPGSNGLALLHEMRSYTDLGAMPVIVITTSADEFSLKDLEPYGVIRLLDKTTVEPDNIVAAVRKALV